MKLFFEILPYVTLFIAWVAALACWMSYFAASGNNFVGMAGIFIWLVISITTALTIIAR